MLNALCQMEFRQIFLFIKLKFNKTNIFITLNEIIFPKIFKTLISHSLSFYLSIYLPMSLAIILYISIYLSTISISVFVSLSLLPHVLNTRVQVLYNTIYFTGRLILQTQTRL